MGAVLREREKGQAKARETFRPSRWLRGAVLAAAAYWVAVFFALVGLQETSNQSFLGVAFFIALFSALGIFYNNTRIEVTGEGLVVRSVSSSRSIRFADIVRIDVRPGFLQTNYEVRARGSQVSFSSMIAGHRRLMQLIVDRAQLGRTQ